jgi:hypothetical protein
MQMSSDDISLDWRSPDEDETTTPQPQVSPLSPLSTEDLATARSDQRWLESIIQDAALFTDWWVKARIIQLAYHPPDEPTRAKHYRYQNGAVLLQNVVPGQVAAGSFPVYAGHSTAAEIGAQVQQELLAHGAQLGLSEQACRQRYAYLFQTLQQDHYAFVYRALSYWINRRFTEAISRNFEVFVKTEEEPCRTFLVVSTAPISLKTRRLLPSSASLTFPHQARFRPLFNVNEMADILDRQTVKTMTLRVHGYANDSKTFYESFVNEAQAMQGVLPSNHIYVGYHWPSEQPFLSPGLFGDVNRNLGIFIKFLLSLLAVSFLFSVLLSVVLAVTPIVPWEFARTGTLVSDFLQQIFIPILGVVFPLWFFALTLLRLVVYQRDRYRAIHYGAPDLAEFFWRLDKRLKQLMDSMALSSDLPGKSVNFMGHSMGGLVIVNALRVLSDRYGKDEISIEANGLRDLQDTADHQLGECFVLGNLILASPDIPLELIREGRNNYVRSAMRRCQRIYLFSSDRDTVLRYLSTLGNWISEPSLQMSGLRLGNVYLRRIPSTSSVLDQVTIRSLLTSEEAIARTSAYDLFERFNYLDCSRMNGVDKVGLGLNPVTALIIDGLNTLGLVLGWVDVHGGYFQTETLAFQLMQQILSRPALTDKEIQIELDKSPGQIAFLPAARYMTRSVQLPATPDF